MNIVNRSRECELIISCFFYLFFSKKGDEKHTNLVYAINKFLIDPKNERVFIIYYKRLFER